MEGSFVEDTFQKGGWDGKWVKVNGLKWWVTDKGKVSSENHHRTQKSLLSIRVLEFPCHHTLRKKTFLFLWNMPCSVEFSKLQKCFLAFIITPSPKFSFKKSFATYNIWANSKTHTSQWPCARQEAPAAQWLSSAMHDAGGSASGNNRTALPAMWKRGTHRYRT